MPIIGSFGAGSKGGYGRGGASPPIDVDYLVVAGGASGGSGSGGGGAGGYRTSFPGGTKITIESGATYTVGAKGVYDTNGVDRGDSTDGNISASGGGSKNNAPCGGGNPGGSGGGGGHRAKVANGTGNQGGYSPP